MKFEETTTADQIKEVGTIVADWFDEGLRIIIMRGPGSFCVYLGVPLEHPIAGFDYDSIPLDCHGGLTFSSDGQRKGRKLDEKIPKWPEGFWWYGYDFAHLGDKLVFDVPGLSDYGKEDRNWTIKEIKDDAWTAIYELKKLMKLAERIKNK